MISNRQNRRRRGGPRGNQNRGNQPNRGNAAQLLDKYKGLARDAQMSGDRVQQEYYLQFADHYFRVLEEHNSQKDDRQQNKPQQQRKNDEDSGPDDGDKSEKKPRRQRRDKPESKDDKGSTKPAAKDEGNSEDKPRRPRIRKPKADSNDDAIAADALPPAISAGDEAA